MKSRSEKDIIGEKEIPFDAYYGINAVLSKENFPFDKKININWYKALGDVKYSYYLLYKDFKTAAKDQYGNKYSFIDDDVIDLLIKAAEQVKAGKYYDDCISPAISGGAGTSFNMNVNEIIANVALEKLGIEKGNYEKVNPLEHANIFQSTNDVIPSSLKVAVLRSLNTLEDKINITRNKTEQLEKDLANNLRISYTQMQEAVPTSYGRLFSTYSDALSRDWWRVSKCFERIKTVNLGGSAIGTGITVPRYFVMSIASKLQEITGLPIARAENLSDNTANLDSFVEIHAILKSHAVNLEKIANDIRLLASDIGGKKIKIAQKQQGSSIMPGKINPVVSEFIISCSHKIYANDSLITNLSAQGILELNPYLPIIGDSILESLELLIACNESIAVNLLKEIDINDELSYQEMIKSAGITTALIPYLGYKKAEKLSIEMKKNLMDVFEANKKLKLIDNKRLEDLLDKSNLLKEGFSLKDIL
jgi:aspartate ammonia-lyase